MAKGGKPMERSMSELVGAPAGATAAAPREEERRLAELALLGVHGCPSEPRFDRLTELLGLSLDTPAVVLGVVGDGPPWILSSIGLARGSCIAGLVCRHAATASGLFLVPDARADRRFDSETQDPSGLISFAGAVLHGPLGRPVGALVVLDQRPRTFDEREISILIRFSALAEQELARDYREAVAQRQAVRPDERCATTGLLARGPGLDRLHHRLASARASGVALALVVADIADFHAINSAFGRESGDRVLEAAAKRLASAVPAEALVFRLQGDQFAVGLELPEDVGGALEGLLSALSTAFSEPLLVVGREVGLHIVFGTALFPSKATTATDLLDRAYLALRRAQEQQTSAEVFTAELEERLVREVAVEHGLRLALAERRLQVAYQPKVDLEMGTISSVEALCRWNDPDLGTVSPAEFIPAAERTGLVVELGRQVLETALLDGLALRAHCPEFTVSVNVAAAQLQDPGFVSDVLRLLEATGAPPDLLELEVVETSVIENIELAIKVIESLRSRGVAFAIDDFGTGYSSLAYLHRLPVQTLKIDRGFISNMTSSPRDAALVRSIVSMSHALDYLVVAEGVETETQADMLRGFGCDFGQGYLFARPAPIAETRALLGAQLGRAFG